MNGPSNPRARRVTLPANRQPSPGSSSVPMNRQVVAFAGLFGHHVLGRRGTARGVYLRNGRLIQNRFGALP